MKLLSQNNLTGIVFIYLIPVLISCNIQERGSFKVDESKIIIQKIGGGKIHNGVVYLNSGGKQIIQLNIKTEQTESFSPDSNLLDQALNICKVNHNMIELCYGGYTNMHERIYEISNISIYNNQLWYLLKTLNFELKRDKIGRVKVRRGTYNFFVVKHNLNSGSIGETPISIEQIEINEDSLNMFAADLCFEVINDTTLFIGNVLVEKATSNPSLIYKYVKNKNAVYSYLSKIEACSPELFYNKTFFTLNDNFDALPLKLISNNYAYTTNTLASINGDKFVYKPIVGRRIVHVSEMSDASLKIFEYKKSDKHLSDTLFVISKNGEQLYKPKKMDRCIDKIVFIGITEKDTYYILYQKDEDIYLCWDTFIK